MTAEVPVFTGFGNIEHPLAPDCGEYSGGSSTCAGGADGVGGGLMRDLHAPSALLSRRGTKPSNSYIIAY